MDRAVDADCADLRRLAAERRADWRAALAAPAGSAGADVEGLTAREDWRAWREGTVLGSLAGQPLEGHRVLLHGLLVDGLAEYAATRPHFAASLPPVPPHAGAVDRLRKLASAAQNESRRLLVLLLPHELDGPSRSAEPWRPELQRLAAAFAARGFSGVLPTPLHCQGATASGFAPASTSAEAGGADRFREVARWESWYAAAEAPLAQALHRRARAFGFRRRRAARTIGRAFRAARRWRELRAAARREAGALALQRAYRGRLAPRLARQREALERAREACLRWRLRRRLLRYVLQRRYLRSDGGAAPAWPAVPSASRAALRIQAAMRGAWCRGGWAYCWAPPFRRPSTLQGRLAESRTDLPALTAAMGRAFAALRQRRRELREHEDQRQRWVATLAGERLLLGAWRREECSRRSRAPREEAVRRRFEAQWARYADGLTVFVQTQGEKEEAWVPTVDSVGQPMWFSQKTGKRSKTDPIDARVLENLARERRKAEQRLEDHLSRVRQVWAAEDLAGEAAYAAGLEELAASRASR